MKLPWVAPKKQEIPTSLGKLFVRKTSNVVVLNNVLSIPRSLVEQLSFFTFLVVLGNVDSLKTRKLKFLRITNCYSLLDTFSSKHCLKKYQYHFAE